MTCRPITAFALQCDSCRARSIVALNVAAILEWCRESKWSLRDRERPDAKDLCGKCRQEAAA